MKGGVSKIDQVKGYGSKSGSYHKRKISNPPTPLPPMFKTAKFQIHQRRYQPN